MEALRAHAAQKGHGPVNSHLREIAYLGARSGACTGMDHPTVWWSGPVAPMIRYKRGAHWKRVGGALDAENHAGLLHGHPPDHARRLVGLGRRAAALGRVWDRPGSRWGWALS